MVFVPATSYEVAARLSEQIVTAVWCVMAVALTVALAWSLSAGRSQP